MTNTSNLGKRVLPPVLYKYRCFDNDYHNRALLNGELYIPTANEFNDPFDANIPYRYNGEELTDANIYSKLLSVTKEAHPDKDESFHQSHTYSLHQEAMYSDEYYLKGIDKLMYERTCNTFGIMSLTPDCQNFLMWSYYADSHKGFCIGYNVEYLISSKIFGAWGFVTYSSEFPTLSLFGSPQQMIRLLFVKGKMWEHEKEYRLVHLYDHEFKKLHAIHKEAIKEVVLGCNLNDNERLKYTLQIKEALPHVDIYEMRLGKKSFAMERNLIYSAI